MGVPEEFDRKRRTSLSDGGMISISAPLLDSDAGPFGGTGMSGIGRPLDPEGLETFRTTRLVWLDPYCGTQDFQWFSYSDDVAFAAPAKV